MVMQCIPPVIAIVVSVLDGGPDPDPVCIGLPRR